MKKIKDLMCFEDEVNKGKTEIREKDSLVLEINEQIIEDDFIKKAKDESLFKNEDKKKRLKGVTKYMKYEGGKIKYIKENPDDITVEEKIKNVINKEKILNEVERRKKTFDLNKFANITLILFLILSSIFVYTYYIKDVNRNMVIDDSDYIAEGSYSQENTTNENLKNNQNGDSGNLLTKENFYNGTNKELKEINSKELRKVNDYLDLRANRGSLITSIGKYKESKEKIYIMLIENQGLFNKDQNLYDILEDDIIKSIAFSDELIEAFNSSSTKTLVKEILNKYALID